MSALDYLDARNEVYLRINKPAVNDLSAIAGIVSIDRITDDHIYIYANQKGFKEFREMNIDYEVLVPPSLQHPVKMSAGNWQPGDWDVYPTFGDYVAAMQQFAIEYPDICLLDTIGFSIMDRPILVVKISDQVTINEPEPGFFYSSNMHGDELPGYVMMIRLIDYLLNGYDSIPLVTDLVDRLQIWINPLANPDGTYHTGDHTVNGATRSNAEGTDLNRNFPSVDLGTIPEDFDCEPETKAMMEFMEEHPTVMSANIHAGAELVNYPWDNWSRPHADDSWFWFVSRQYADTVQFYSHQNPAFDEYFIQLNNGITNGYAWYPAYRTRQDYVTYYLHGREVTLEICIDKTPPARQLPLYWEYNYRSFLYYMQQALFGFTGTVTDKDTGDPLRAMVSILDHDCDNSHVYSDSITGRYYRPIWSTYYDLEFSAPGYLTRRINDTMAINLQALEINVQLEKQPSSIANSDPGSLTVKLLSNPIGEELTAVISAARPVTAGYCLFNLYGQQVTRPGKTLLKPGHNSLRIDVSALKPGCYILHITTSSRKINRVVVKM